MQRHVIIQSGVDAACAKPVGDRPETQHQKGAACGKSEQSDRGNRHAKRRDLSCAEPFRHTVALQAGDDRADRNDNGDHARVRYGNAKLRIHARPCGAEQSIGKSEADKRKIDDC